MIKANEQIQVNKGVMWLLGGVTPLTIISAVFYLGVKQNDIESRIFKSPSEKEHVTTNALNEDIHVNYRDQAIEFVPRTEVEYKLNNIQEDLKEIKQALRINN